MNKVNLFDFNSPPWENSLYKKLPIQEYNRLFMKDVKQIVGQPIRVKFRGPRPEKYGRSSLARRGTCLKEDAVTFAIYYR